MCWSLTALEMWWVGVSPEPKRILLLAGTAEARELAERLVRRTRLNVIASLAGAVSNPTPLPVKTRIGGFGGADGLARFIVSEKIDIVIDATHPYAAQMKTHVDQAFKATGVEAAHLIRPTWCSEDGDHWQHVRSVNEAAEKLPSGARPFLSIGRREIGLFAVRPDIYPIARMIDPPDHEERAEAMTILLSHPQADWRAEKDLFQKHGVTHLLTKNSGGTKSRAKLLAARSLSLPVIMIDRPPLPAAPILESVDAAELWIRSVLGG